MDILKGLENIFGVVKSSVQTSDEAAKDPNVETPANSVGDDVGAAVTEIEQLISHIQSKDVSASAEDVFELVKKLFTILDKFGINIPVVSTIIKAL